MNTNGTYRKGLILKLGVIAMARAPGDRVRGSRLCQRSLSGALEKGQKWYQDQE